MTEFEKFTFEINEKVGLITFNQPKKSNALTVARAVELDKCFDVIAANDQIRAVLITGSGDSFSSGGDLDEMKAAVDSNNLQSFIKNLIYPVYAIAQKIRKLPKPVIAAVNGWAVGAGMNLSLACDMIIASEKATFCESFINLGFIPGMGGTYFLPRHISFVKATELLFTGKRISAKKAYEIGLINQVVKPQDLMPTALELAAELADKPTLAIARTKNLLNQTYSNTMEEHLKNELNDQILTSADQDCKEGIMAFSENRKPVFQGK